MPTIRPRTVVDDEYVAQTSYTIDLDLPTSGILSTLWLIVKARTKTTTVGTSPWMKNLISSISVNQGGAAFLNSARPAHFQADYFYKTGNWPRMGYRRWETVGDILEVIPILFGNKVDDLEHTIDLSKLSDPKLSVTYDLATKPLDLYTVWDTTYYPRFSVIADLFEGPGIPASKGYHSLRQVETYNPANSEIHLLELKGTRPIKAIYFQGDNINHAYCMRQYIDEITIHGDNEAWVPLRMKSERFAHYVQSLFGWCDIGLELQYFSCDYDMDGIVEEYVMRQFELHNTRTRVAFCYGGSGRGFKPSLVNIAGGDETGAGVAEAGFYNVRGIAPWSVYPIDFKKMLGMDYLDPTLHKPVYLELEHSSNAETTQPGPMRLCLLDLVKG